MQKADYWHLIVSAIESVLTFRATAILSILALKTRRTHSHYRCAISACLNPPLNCCTTLTRFHWEPVRSALPARNARRINSFKNFFLLPE